MRRSHRRCGCRYLHAATKKVVLTLFGFSTAAASRERIDHNYMESTVLPKAGNLAGSNGYVLVVGYTPSNASDVTIAGLAPHKCFFVEYDVRQLNLMNESGTLVVGDMIDLVRQPRFQHAFCVIVDFLGAGWKPAHTGTPKAHRLEGRIRAYSALLAHGGSLILKFDGETVNNEPAIWAWPQLHAKLLAQDMELEQVDVIHSEACSSKLVNAFTNVTNVTGGNVGKAQVMKQNATQLGYCESYLFSQWWWCDPSQTANGGVIDRGAWHVNGASSLARFPLPHDEQTRPPSKLMIVAHPDDEIIFGGAELLQALPGTWLVVCITTATARSAGKCSKTKKRWERRQEFFHMLKLVGAHGEIWDRRVTWPRGAGFSSDDIEQLMRDLSELIKSRTWEVVVTHGRDGEYENVQHQQLHRVACAAARAVGLAEGKLRFFRFQNASLPVPLRDLKYRTALKAYPSQAFVIKGARGAPSLDKWLRHEAEPVASESCSDT